MIPALPRKAKGGFRICFFPAHFCLQVTILIFFYSCITGPLPLWTTCGQTYFFGPSSESVVPPSPGWTFIFLLFNLIVLFSSASPRLCNRSSATFDCRHPAYAQRSNVSSCCNPLFRGSAIGKSLSSRFYPRKAFSPISIFFSLCSASLYRRAIFRPRFEQLGLV